MTIVMYDLVAADDRRFSPFCWRTRMAIAHKALGCDARPTPFTEIANICDGRQRRIPVIEDGDKLVADSWTISEYLDDAYPERAPLFDGESGKQLARFVKNWTDTQILGQILTLIVRDVHDHILPADRAFFRETRERRFGKSLEEVQEGRDDRLERFQALLTPLALTLDGQPYLGGEAPQFADHIVFGAFQWPRVISSFGILPEEGPIADWFERCLNLYDGIGREIPAYS